MRLTFLGSGSAFVDFRVNYQNNGLVETDEGPVLIDCGATALQSLRELGVSPHDVRAVLITHLHADHASPEALVGTRYYTGPDGEAAGLRTLIVAPEDVARPLRGALEPYLDEHSDKHGVLRTGGVDELVLLETATRTVIGGVEFTFFRVPHVVGPGVDKPAYGVVIDDGRDRLVWSGDTTLDRRWLDRELSADRTRRVFHDCTFARQGRGPAVHAHIDHLRALPHDWTARITLMHHTAVPPGQDVSMFAGAAHRHERFDTGDAPRAGREPVPPGSRGM